MAKTTSQIVAENKKKREEAAKIQASRDKIHQQQMADVAQRLQAAKSSASTADQKAHYQAAQDSYDKYIRPEMEKNLPWTQRTDYLRDAREKVSSDSGKSYYQRLMERIMQRDRELSAKWGSTHQQIGSTYLTGSGGYNAPLNEHYNNAGQAYLEDRKDLDELLEEKHWMDYVQKYTGKEFEDDFLGQTSANYTMGRLSQDSSLAWNAYLENPTDANRRDAETIDQLMTEIQWNNQDVYADDGKLPWLSKTLANYIPQFLDQMKYSGSFGAAGALTGNAQGVKAGMVLGSGAYSYMTMRGAAFKSLLEAGVPEEQARAAAKDEAVVSSLIEMGDTAIDLVTLGGGKLINVLSAGSVDAIKNQIAKGVGKNVLTKLAAALANYGINIGSEWLEEATQESVSIANQNNPDGGIPGLVQDAAGVFFGSVLDSESEEGQQIREAGAEGAKIAAMMGGIQGITNAAARRIATNGKMAADQQEQRVPEQLPPEAQEQNQGDILQQMPEQSPQESFQEEQEVETAVSDPEVPTVTLEDLSAKYGAQAGAMEQTYRIGGGDQDVAKFDRAYEMAYNMGKSGVNESYAMKSQATSYLTEDQRKFAFQAGQYAAETAAQDQAAKNASAANGKTGWKKGVVKGEGVQIADLTKTFNDPQRAAYRTLSTIAEATGIDVVLYQSQQNQDGRFEGSQGKFKWNENAIYIDVNAGLSYAKDVGELSKYTMLRTFDHEFTHFVEKWNPQQYNELRKTVFDTLTEQGMNVEDLIDLKMAQDSTGKLTYDLASREVVAEAMTDILPDSSFVETLAKKNRTLFETLLSKFKEFLSNVKSYFVSLAQNPSKEARALQKQMGDTVSYLENIVKMFDQAAVKAVEQYQSSVAEEVKQDKKSDEKPVSKPKSAESTEQKPDAKEEKQDAKTSQPAANKEEQAPKAVQEQEYQDDNGFTVRTNSQYGTLEISFTSKPDAAIRDVLKANKFRWNGKKGVWYGKADQQTIVDALRGAYEKLKQAPAEEQNTVEPAAMDETAAQSDMQPEVQEAQQPEPVDEVQVTTPEESAGPYEKLREGLKRSDLFIDDSFTFRIEYLSARKTYSGRIVATSKNKYIENARSVRYVSQQYTTRQEAIDDIVAVAENNKFLGDLNISKEGSGNAEETGGVLSDRSDGAGASRLLADQQAGTLPGDGADRTSVADAGERGNEAGRYDNRPDAERDVGGYGEGSSPVGDLRGNDDLTEEKPQSETPAFRETVDEQIQQKSTEQPKGSNFVIGDSLDLPKGDKSRYKANVEAIRLVKKLQAESRYATAEEQKVLSKYVGWGGLANAFDQKKTEWAKEYAELKELLSEEEYNQARGSTLNAHYTDISVIKAMYAGLKQMGFTGGRMLEPASGVGNFVGAMPADMSSQVKSWTMVELDGITGLIAKYLYPNSDVRIEGFENAKIPDNYMDVAIGNVPFGNFPIYDKAYPKKVTSAIHNYFFAKSLDKVRPGGIVMFITSSYTMNSKDSTVRRYIMSKADLLGAIRLPGTAFKENANTEVVTDILILKKRPDKTSYSGVDFLESPWTYPVKGDYRGANINQYFKDHPEMVLGEPSFSGGMYRGDSLTYQPYTDKGPLSVQIQNAFANIKGKMDYPYVRSPERTNFQVERASKKMKPNGLTVKDGKVFQNQDGELVEVPVPKGTAERISGMLEIRDAVRDLQNFQQQGLTEDTIRQAREKLNKLYDDFVVKHGFLNSQANRTAIKNDPDKFSLFALENYNTETKKATKADIFSKNTIAPNRTITSVASVSEGLIVSINQTGRVDTALISKLSGVDENSVVRELLDSRKVFKNRDGVLEPAEMYLSGNVRAKLRDAEALAPLDPDYQKNVEALKSVIPPTVSYDEIFVNPGTPWIPNDVYSDFAAYILGGVNTGYRKAVDVTRNPETGNFTVELIQQNLKWNALNLQKWGTNKRSFLDLYDAMLNSKSVVVRYKDADGVSVIDKDATAAANEKIENIQKEFQKWLWEDETRRDELQKLYNETFNAIVTPKYDGTNLTVNGANAMKPLRPHQRDAVQRVISSGGNTLLAHKVGAGKTYEMAAAAMKLKQLGLVKKPMFVVPKSLVAQWGNEFMDFFPTAKLLVAEAGDFTKDSRKIFANRISNGEYDAVILSYEQFEKLPISDSFARELYEEQIDSVIAAIEEAKAEKGGKSLSVKDLEKKRKSLQTKIDKLTDTAKDQDNIEFEKLGVDGLFVDEAHNFKNLFYTTSMTNVAGLGNKDGSKRAFDLYTKVRYLQKLNGGRGIVFATATPVMNSMSEMYIMQKYLQPDLLDQMGLSTFDAWAKQFGEVVNGVEIKPSGQGYRVKQSFSRFKNMSELQLLFRNFADVLTDIPGLKIPKLKGGKVQVVVCEPGQFQKDYMKLLEERADNVKNVDPSVDNMLKITSDGRKISYTQRMIDPSLPYEEGCKIYRCADNVVQQYRESSKIKGTQLIFCDMATPKGKSKTETTQTDDTEIDMESARLYEDIKARLVQKKIPAKEIAFIHEADTDAKKKKLFADVNEGKVRVLIGSTGKMGVGMNAQKRVVAIHHLDAPWRPGDVEQRNGRAFRQGNINDEVTCFTYVTEGSFDARLWDILDRKQGFINQIMNGENVGREVEDTGEVTLSAAEVKALASGSPLILEQVQLDTEIKKLESLYRSHLSSVANAKELYRWDLGQIATLNTMIANGKKDVQARTDAYQDGKFKITIGKKTYTEKKDAGTAMMTAALSKATEDGYTSIGEFAGFQIEVVKTSEGIKGNLRGTLTYQFNTYPGNTTYMVNHLVSIVEGLPGKVSQWETRLQETKADLKEQETLMVMPFEKQGELDQKRARYSEVMEILNPKEEQKMDLDDEQEHSEKPGMIQYQSRRYLKDHNEPDSAREWSAFNRSFANKTNGLKPGETTNITIYTADNVYFVEATGYMEGTIVRKMSLNENIALVDAFMEEFKNGTELGTKGNHQPDAFSKGNHGGYSGDYASVTGTEAAGGNAVLAGAESAGDNVRDYWESLGFNSEEELIEAVKSGALVMDENGDLVTFEQYQPRTRSLTDQEILEIAADDLRLDELTEGERDALQIFRDRITRLNDLQEQRADLGTQYREQQFGANGQKVDRAEAEKTRERMKILDSQIAKAQAGILDVQNKAVLRKVLQKARKVVETKQREKDAVVLSRWRDRRNNAEEIQKYRKRIAKDVKSMTDWVINPSNKDVVKHIPDALKNTVIPFLSSIDFTSKRQLRGGNATKADAEFIKRLDILKSAMRNRMNDDNTGMYSGYTDLPPDFMERLDSFVDSAKAITGDGDGEFIINRMTASELRELSSIVKSLKKLVQDFNRFHANAMYQHVYDAANATIQELAVYHDAPSRTKVGESVNNFLFWEQIRPAYAFERFGKGGVAIYDGLRRGQAQLAFDTKEIVDFSEKAYTEQEVREWDKEVKEIHLGATVVRMKVSQIMSLYALSKRKQAFGHIVGNGIRVSTFFDKGKKVSDTGHKLAPQQIGQIIGVLTPRQIEVADQLQQFMQNKGGQWGNYVSLKRFGENLFGEPNYFPINSDGRHLEATADENPSAASLYALLNMGFTKKTVEKAKNRIVIYSIFDVFANHMASMAQYHSMALPVLDALKWFNYNQDGSVRDELNRVFGAPEESRPGSGKRGYAENFVIGILKAFNGTEAQGVPSDTRGMNALRRFNMAQVAYNARVVVQQPLAVTRAAMLLDYASIAKGMKLSASAIQKNIQEMNKYSGIAAWKSLGFYDTNISRGLTSIIKHDETIMDKISEVGMIGAEKADQITWAGIWSACKEEIRRKKPDIETGSDAYFQAVTDLFEDVVYKTQVVDSVLTKNEFLRSKGLFARLTGSFMSEPTTTASMVLDAFDKYRMDLQLGMSKTVAWERNRKNIVRTVYVYSVGAVALAAVQAVADAFRDDDDYATFLEKWLDAFGGNLTDELMPFNKLPLLSDFYELAKELAGIFGLDTYGNPPQSVYMQWYDSLVKGFEILYQKITGEDTNYTWYAGAYKMLQALSGIVGIPMAATTREIVTAWNSTIGTMAPSLKVKTYDSGDMNNIKYAYLDGYLTDAEATQELMSKGLVDNENEAYWKIREWDADGEYSRYDSLYQAARNGQSIQQAMEEFTSHGYTEKEVLSKLKSQIGTWYEAGEISKQQAVDMLEKYMDMDSQSIDATVNKWSSKVVTGIAFEDIKEEFLSGNLTASRAAEMYVRYGGYTKEDAQATVKGWQFEQEWGFAYSQRKSAYKSGQITDSELRTILMDMGGKTAEEAEQDIAVYDWEMEVPGSDGISYAAIRDYYESVEPYGVAKGTYTKAWKIKNSAKGVDADGDGKKDAYSVVKEVFPQIAALPISSEQKDALAHCWWSDSTVRKYKTW